MRHALGAKTLAMAPPLEIQIEKKGKEIEEL